MMLGKRSRPPFRRTTSMTGMTVDVRDMETAAAPPPPPPPIGGEFSGYNNHMLLSPRYLRSDFNLETADFLRRCGLCRRHLAPGHDIYMYRGDAAFCSLECREQQMKQDERKERRATAAPKNGENHHRSELPSAANETSGNSEFVAAA